MCHAHRYSFVPFSSFLSLSSKDSSFNDRYDFYLSYCVFLFLLRCLEAGLYQKWNLWRRFFLPFFDTFFAGYHQYFCIIVREWDTGWDKRVLE